MKRLLNNKDDYDIFVKEYCYTYPPTSYPCIIAWEEHQHALGYGGFDISYEYIYLEDFMPDLGPDHVYTLAVKEFGKEAAFQFWNTRLSILNNLTPREYAVTPMGDQRVRDLIGQILYGIPL